jgi:uncharacterized protein DUF998
MRSRPRTWRIFCCGTKIRPGELALSVAVDGLRQTVTANDSERLLPLAVRALADRATMQRDRGDDPAATLDRLRDLRREFPAAVANPEAYSRLERSVLAAQQDLADAEQARAVLSADEATTWHRAAEACRAAGTRWDEAYCRRGRGDSRPHRPGTRGPAFHRRRTHVRRDRPRHVPQREEDQRARLQHAPQNRHGRPPGTRPTRPPARRDHHPRRRPSHRLRGLAGRIRQATAYDGGQPTVPADHPTDHDGDMNRARPAAAAALTVAAGASGMLFTLVARPEPWWQGYVSEAGAAGQPHAGVYRLSLLVLALGVALLGRATRRVGPLLLGAAVLAGTSGVVPCSSRCPLPPYEPTTPADLIHTGASILGMAVLAAAMAVAWSTTARPAIRRLTAAALALTVPLGAVLAMMMLFAGRGTVSALLERILLVVAVSWLIGTALLTTCNGDVKQR